MIFFKDTGCHYKVKLVSGRILGPLDLEKIKIFILNGVILGNESVREYPRGVWKNLNQIPEIAQLLISHLNGSLKNFNTLSAETIQLPSVSEKNDSLEEKTELFSFDEKNQTNNVEKTELFSTKEINSNKISLEKTVFSDFSTLKKKNKIKINQLIRVVFIGGFIGYFSYDFLNKNEEIKTDHFLLIKPILPSQILVKPNPNKSMQIYLEAMQNYALDNLEGYKVAAEKLNQSASYDIGNVKALAMLASVYINLIDYSNKDENYFSVLSKLIDMSRAKSIDIPETVIADTEFFIVVNKAQDAQKRIVDYTRSHQNFGPEMFYYLSLSFYSRGDINSADRYIDLLPDQSVFSAKVYYLRGLINENLKNFDKAIDQYKKGISFNSNHVRSYLRVAHILNGKGLLKEASYYIEFLLKNKHLLFPKELAEAYFLHGQLSELNNDWGTALRDVEKSVQINPENHDYLLELYSLKSKSEKINKNIQKNVKMYYYLEQGERLIQKGKYQEALVPLLEARQADNESALPLIKIGDMFNYLYDIENSKMNYKLACERSKNDIQVWSKYIQSLIKSYEWEEAEKVMAQFRSFAVSQSFIDKAAADMYQKQGRFIEAQVYYRKAMSRDQIDPDVYIAYAKSLMTVKNYKDAPFFFALALRLDPLNIEAVIGNAKCVAETESLDRAISMLKDKMQQNTEARAEFFAAIAEFQIQKGDWDQAQQSIDQAVQANPRYAYPWKLQAQVYLNQENVDSNALNKALAAYKSYSDRNASDPSGYLERYRILAKKLKYEEAAQELRKIYSIYPKYPKLHYYFGLLYVAQGNHKTAVEEFRLEFKNNPNAVDSLIAFGKSLLEIGEAQESLEIFSRAMKLAPLSSEAKQNAGWANYQLKNYQASIALIRTAIALDKGNPILYKRLGAVYQGIGDMVLACVAFKKYLEMEPDAPDKASFQVCQ